MQAPETVEVLLPIEAGAGYHSFNAPTLYDKSKVVRTPLNVCNT
jgi:hypothetical protein